MIIIFVAIICSVSPFFVFSQPQESLKNKYAYYLRGLLFIENGDFNLALKELNQAKMLDPTSISIRLKIIYSLIQLGEFSRAEKELKVIKKIDPNNPKISLVLSLLYSFQGKDLELEKEYEEFLKLSYAKEPSNRQIAENLAQFYIYKNRYNEAINIYQEIVKNDPEYVDGLFWLGYLYEETNRRQDAIRLWELALKISPSHALVLNSLGYIYAEEGINLDAAEEMIKKALNSEPENGAFLDSLGWVYFKKNDYKNAEYYLLAAYNLLKDPVIYEHLGDLYIRLDMPQKAIFYYKEGLKYFPKNIKLREKLNMYGSQNKVIKK
ncbi:MAG: tetratricopeptide repeat protein [Candidatus Omnitrophica bacterium]|nr:tetratricopeptide repeat protein [Candidatus Omnitrophota bacterium]